MSESNNESEAESEIVQALLFIVEAPSDSNILCGEYVLLPLLIRNFSRPVILRYVLKTGIDILTTGKEYPDLRPVLGTPAVEVIEILLDCAITDWDCSSINVYTDPTNQKNVGDFFRGKFCVQSSKSDFKWTTDEDTAAVLGSLLVPGVEIPISDCEGGVLLHLAARRDDTTLAKLLLDKRANINARTKHGRTPLYVAAEANSIKVTSSLLKNGAIVDDKATNGSTPLHAAARKGHVQVCELLLQHGANISAVVSGNSLFRGATALHLAMGAGKPEIVDLLLKNGANVHAAGYLNGSSLQIAIAKGCARIVDSILNQGIDVTAPKNKATFLTAVRRSSDEWKPIVERMLQSGFSLSAEDAMDSRLLHSAVRHNYLPVVEKLIDLGADVNRWSSASNSRKTALHVAAEYASADVIALLLRNDADVNKKCRCGKTPLFYAAQAGNLGAAGVLLKAGADVTIRDNTCETVLNYACIFNRPEMVKLLVKNGADVNERTPIILATRLGFSQVVEVLCQAGAQVDIKTPQNRTALHEAARLGFHKLVKVLIKNGADIDVPGDVDNRTPLFDAVTYENFQTFQVLLALGAYIAVTSAERESVLHIAAGGNYRVFEYLLEYFFTLTGLLSGVSCFTFSYPIKNKKSIVILKNHVTKMKKFGFDVYKKEIERVWCWGYDYYTTPSVSKEECEKEVLRLKTTFIGSTRVSYYDFVLVDARRIARYLRNESFAQTLKLNHKSLFPIYGNIIKYHLLKGRQRFKLMEDSAVISRNLFREYGTLAFELVENILGYLSDREIIILRHVCASAK